MDDDEISTVPTEATDESSLVDSIISTFCCNGSYDSLQSYKDEVRRKKEILRKKKAKQIEAEHKASPTLWERLSDIAIFVFQGAPPVKFVKCFECSSVDESEVTTPRALIEMAHDYDKNTNKKYRSMSPAEHASVTSGSVEINPATSLKPLLLRYKRSGLKLKNGTGGSIAESKGSSQRQLRAPTDNIKPTMNSSRNMPRPDARSVAYNNESRKGTRQVAKHTDGRSVATRRTVRDERSARDKSNMMSRRSKNSAKFEI
jgi:hypothetical protein